MEAVLKTENETVQTLVSTPEQLEKEPKTKVLIVDDETTIRRILETRLKLSGYQVDVAIDGEEAIEKFNTYHPDIVILDIMLPKIDGFAVCKEIRSYSEVPVIILSAVIDVADRIKGLEMGADDYVTKPFSPRELVARVKRVLARAEAEPTMPKRYIKGKVEIDLEDFKVKVAGKEEVLTEKEKAILKALVSRPCELLTHEQILDMVWGENNIVEYGNIDVHICHLREKLEKDPENPQLIKTVKGEGYKFEL